MDFVECSYTDLKLNWMAGVCVNVIVRHLSYIEDSEFISCSVYLMVSHTAYVILLTGLH